MRLECPIHGIVPREETVKGYEIARDEYVRFEPDELKALEQASSSALVIDTFVPEGAIDPVYFEKTYYLGAGKNGAACRFRERGGRVGGAPLHWASGRLSYTPPPSTGASRRTAAYQTKSA
jgi:Ku70/Ku80 beta-barrel domain